MLTGGIKQSTSVLAGDGYITLKNVSKFNADSVQLRPGLVNRINQGGRVMTSFIDSSNNPYILHVNGSSLTYTSTTYDSNPTTLESVSSTAYGTFASMDGRMYYADGTVFKYVTNALGSGNAGFNAPPGAIGSPTITASGGSITAGDHLYRYRYSESATGYVSNPSGALLVTHAEDDSAEFSVGTSATDIIRSSDSRIDKIILEMTEAGGSVFYDVAYFDNSDSSVTVTMSDTTLAEQLRRANGADVGNSPPPSVPIIASHRARLFGLGVSGNRTYLYWSGAGKPEGWNTLDEARTIFSEGGDIPTALFSAYGDLYAFGLRSTTRVSYVSSPATAMLEDLPTDLGAWNARCVVWVDDAVFGWGPGGIWRLGGMMPRSVDEDIRDTLKDQINYNTTAYNLYHIVHHTEDNCLLLFYPPAGSTDVTGCLVYDLGKREWRNYDYNQSITASCSANAANGNVEPYLSNDNSQSWHLQFDSEDGIDASDPSVVTVKTAISTTVIEVNEAISATDSMKGAFLYRPASGSNAAEEIRIASNTLSQITLSSAASRAFEVGEELWVGSFEYDVAPKWRRFPNSDGESRPARTIMTFIPDTTSGSKCELRIYRDFDTSPLEFTKNDADLFPKGFEILSADGQDYADIDYQYPFVSSPMFSDWGRFWRWRITGRRPGTFHLVDVDMTMDKQDAMQIRDD